MLQVCSCGWTGDVEDQEVVYAGDGDVALECPGCGRRDRVEWLPARNRAALVRIAVERHMAAARRDHSRLTTWTQRLAS